MHSNVETFLEKMNELKKRVVLVTNAHPVSYAIKMEVTGLQKYFNNVVNAHDLKIAKENDGFWQALQSVEPFKSESTLFIDDSEEVLACAEKYGFIHLLSIVKPDSKKQDRQSSNYPMLNDFSDITP